MTCLCLTRNRREWLPKALECYRKQTYPERELLVLSDGADVRDLLPEDEAIQHVHLGESRHIGEKRNVGCSLASGDIIADWDDDDWSEPERLSDQVGRLLESGKAVTGYHSMRFRSEYTGEWWIYEARPEDQPKYSLGTSLVFWKQWWEKHPFPALHIGEDGAFAAEAARNGQLAAAAAGDFMYATIHDGNTSPKLTGRKGWRKL